MEYRRGRLLDTTTQPVSKVSVQQQLARYRSIQDGCGAIRSIIKKNTLYGTTNADKFFFKINTNQVFIGGQSAGGIVALGAAYYQTSTDLVTNQSMIDSSFPKAPGSTYNIQQVLGKMHQTDFYYANADPQYWPNIKGVASLWGGIVIPKTSDNNESGFFNQQINPINPPLIAFHGAMDDVIPFYDDATQNINLSPVPVSNDPNFNSESLICAVPNRTFMQAGDGNKQNGGVVELKSCSSLNMYRVLKKLNKFTELYVDCSMKHGLDDCDKCVNNLPHRHKNKITNMCEDCDYTSDFGSGAINPKLTIEYMAGRIAVFSQTLMASATPLAFGSRGNSALIDCRNDRKCTQTTYTVCSGSTLCDSSDVIGEEPE